MTLKTPPEFDEKFPFLKRWLEKEVEEAEHLPMTVERSDIPRGELYPLTRPKTLLALTQAVFPMIGFSLKQLASQFQVPYGTVRNWATQKRVKDLKWEFAERFVDEFLAELSEALKKPPNMRAAMAGTGEMASLKLIDEAVLFKGAIQRAFLKKATRLWESGADGLMKVSLKRFTEEIINHLRPDRPFEFSQFYPLFYQIETERRKSKFDNIKAAIRCGALESAISQLEILKEIDVDTLVQLSQARQDFWRLKSYTDFRKKATDRELKKFERWKKRQRKSR